MTMTMTHVLLLEQLTYIKLTWVLGKEKPKSNKDAAKSVSTKNSRSKPQENEATTYLKESQVQKMSAEEYEKKL